MRVPKFNVTFSSFKLLLLILVKVANISAEDYKYVGGLDSGHLDDRVHIDVHGHEQDDGPSSHPLSGNSNLHPGNCRLPNEWKGKWFQSGVPQPIVIDSRAITTKGTCYDSSEDKFLFIEPGNNNCHRCIVINERHPNVLQYKESVYCEEKDMLDNLCSKIPGDAQLYSLFRLDAVPQDCPFKAAPFTFTYNRGYGECKNPVSHVDSCTESTRILLRYQACPDVQKTESTVEELQCLAEWREGSQNYVVGKIRQAVHRLSASNEDSYRCFVYERVKGHGGVTTGFKVAQSGDATCTGVSSPTEGARTLTFTKVEPSASKCKFPGWFTFHHWHTLDGKMSVRATHKDTAIHVIEEARRNATTSGHHHSVDYFATGNYGTVSPYVISGGSRVSCQNVKEVSERHVAVLAHHTIGCKKETVCMHIYKRDQHIVEIQMRPAIGSDDGYECNNKVAPSTIPIVTLISAETTNLRCPYLGKYMATGVTQDGRVVRDACASSMGQGAFNTLVVGCGNRATMEFHSNCPNQEPTISYACHGSWEEGGMGFLIASPLSRSSRRYCFIYTNTPGGLQVSSNSENCRRNVSPGVEGTWAFNLTVEGQCAEAVTAAADAVSIQSFAVMIPSLAMTVILALLLQQLQLISPLSSCVSSSSFSKSSPSSSSSSSSSSSNLLVKSSVVSVKHSQQNITNTLSHSSNLKALSSRQR